MAPESLHFLNDFEAIGFAIAAMLDPGAPLLAVPRSPTALHSPPPATAAALDGRAPACCVGAGTGLGACIVVPVRDPTRGIVSERIQQQPAVRARDRRSEGASHNNNSLAEVLPQALAPPAFTVIPSEAGMAAVVCPHDEQEWRLLQVRRDRVDVLPFRKNLPPIVLSSGYDRGLTPSTLRLSA